MRFRVTGYGSTELCFRFWTLFFVVGGFSFFFFSSTAAGPMVHIAIHGWNRECLDSHGLLAVILRSLDTSVVCPHFSRWAEGGFLIFLARWLDFPS